MYSPGQSAQAIQNKGRGSRPKRSDTVLALPAPIMPDAALRAFIDDCIVPALVQEFITERRSAETEQPQKGEPR